MKKIIFSTICIISAVVMFCGCSTNTVTYSPSGAYWQENVAANSVTNVDEEVTYNITYAKAGEDDLNNYFGYALNEGKMSIHLTAEELNGTLLYKLTTTTSVKGSYIFDDAESAFEDSSTAVCYFNWNGNFTPVKSTKEVFSTIPCGQTGATDGKGNRVITLNHKIETIYGDNGATAEVKFEITGDKEALASYYSLEDGSVQNYKKLTKHNYLDNEMMLFAFRSFNIDESFTYSYYTIDALSGTNRSMNCKIKSVNETTSETITATYTKIVGSVQSAPIAVDFSTYRVAISINNTFSGSSIVCNYAQSANNRKRLIKMTTELPYSLGSLVYLIDSVSEQ